MNETKKPAIRFQGFSDEWKQSRVGELIEDYTEKTVVQNQYPVLTSSQQQGIVRQEEYFADRQVTTNDNVGYFVLPFGYFTYRSRSDTDVFVFNRNNLIDKGIISYYYPVFAPKSCDSNFLLRRLNYGIKKQLSMAAEGTGQKVLAHSKFKDMVVDVPDEEEQIKIGAIFEYVDNLIAQHQSKLEKYQAVKVSMLEKLFPKDGADVPEIRFKGFSEAWKRRYASEIFTSHTDKGHPELPVLSATQDIGMVIRDTIGKSVFHDTANEKGYKRVMPGQFVIHLRSFQGGFAHSAIEGITSPAYTVFGFTEPEKHDDYYWKYVFSSKQFIKRLETVTYGIRDGRSISYEEFLTLDFLFPQKKEQIKISTYLRNLDLLISLRQQELDKLKSIKKALLEKMFV